MLKNVYFFEISLVTQQLFRKILKNKYKRLKNKADVLNIYSTINSK